MKLHGNARLTPHGRRLLVERVLRAAVSRCVAAEAAGVSHAHGVEVGGAAIARRARSGWRSLLGAAPGAGRTPRARVAAIAALRRLRMTAAEIAELLEMALSTVSAVLLRIGLGKRSRLEPLEPANRYERQRPGELRPHRHQEAWPDRRRRAPHHAAAGAARRAHDDVARATGTVGWEYVHVCVDDATRLAYVEVLDDEKAHTVAGFLRRAVAFYAALRHPRRTRHDRQRLAATAPPSTRSPAAPSASATCAPAPTDRAPTAKPNASSAPCSAAGRTARSTAPSRTHTRPRRLARPLQSPTTTRQPQPPAAPHPPRAD